MQALYCQAVHPSIRPLGFANCSQWFRNESPHFCTRIHNEHNLSWSGL